MLICAVAVAVVVTFTVTIRISDMVIKVQVDRVIVNLLIKAHQSSLKTH